MARVITVTLPDGDYKYEYKGKVVASFAWKDFAEANALRAIMLGVTNKYRDSYAGKTDKIDERMGYVTKIMVGEEAWREGGGRDGDPLSTEMWDIAEREAKKSWSGKVKDMPKSHIEALLAKNHRTFYSRAVGAILMRAGHDVADLPAKVGELLAQYDSKRREEAAAAKKEKKVEKAA